MYKEQFALRLARLRTRKGVSARDMSLSIGQNPSYINNIETGKALPSMSMFFYICDYLELSPSEFFDETSRDPEKLNEIIENLKKLSDSELSNISAIIKGLAENK